MRKYKITIRLPRSRLRLVPSARQTALWPNEWINSCVSYLAPVVKTDNKVAYIPFSNDRTFGYVAEQHNIITRKRTRRGPATLSRLRLPTVSSRTRSSGRG